MPWIGIGGGQGNSAEEREYKFAAWLGSSCNAQRLTVPVRTVLRPRPPQAIVLPAFETSEEGEAGRAAAMAAVTGGRPLLLLLGRHAAPGLGPGGLLPGASKPALGVGMYLE